MKVLTDHKELEYFMITKKLISQQVKWTEFLSEFNFVVSYQNGKKNNKADALTRKPNKRPTEDEDEQWQHHIRVLLLSNQIDQSAELQPIEESEKNDWINSDTNSNASNKILLLPEQVMESNQNNKLCSKIHLYLANPKRLNKLDVYLKDLRVENGLLMKEDQLWVADKSQLQLEIIKKIHNQPAVGFPSTEKMLEMAQRHYYWSRIKEMIQQFIRNC